LPATESRIHHDVPPALAGPPTLERAARALHHAGHSQRASARELNIDRRKIKRILDQAA
jgi:ActR/RegA family two-component response regulator